MTWGVPVIIGALQCDRIAQFGGILVGDPSTNWYECSHCGHIHIGHTRMGEAEQFVMTLDRASLAEVLLKLRGQAKHKQIAAAAGVRPIRLKEWEDPGHDAPSLEALFAVLRVYRVRVGFSLPVSRR